MCTQRFYQQSRLEVLQGHFGHPGYFEQVTGTVQQGKGHDPAVNEVRIEPMYNSN